jgi:hypothetical protein
MQHRKSLAWREEWCQICGEAQLQLTGTVACNIGWEQRRSKSYTKLTLTSLPPPGFSWVYRGRVGSQVGHPDQCRPQALHRKSGMRWSVSGSRVPAKVANGSVNCNISTTLTTDPSGNCKFQLPAVGHMWNTSETQSTPSIVNNRTPGWANGPLFSRLQESESGHFTYMIRIFYRYFFLYKFMTSYFLASLQCCTFTQKHV